MFTVNDITEIVKVTTIINNAFETKQGFGYGLEYCKKIILTTDQDLIKDGIQAIDDEFLEWFVKNPNCEVIKVNKLCYGALSGFADAGYKIIIPKEEHKQERMYSEEEAGELVYSIIGQYANQVNIMIDGDIVDRLFEQFKKK